MDLVTEIMVVAVIHCDGGDDDGGCNTYDYGCDGCSDSDVMEIMAVMMMIVIERIMRRKRRRQ